MKYRSRSAPPAFPVMRLASLLSTIFLVILTVGNMISGRLQPAQVAQTNFAQQPALGMGGGGGGGGGDLQSQQSLIAPEEAAGESQAGPESGEAKRQDLSVTPLPAGTESLLSVPAPLPTPVVEMPPEALSKIPLEPAPAGSTDVDAAGTEIGLPAISVVGILQILLAILAVITGLLAIYLRRSTR